MAPEIKQISKYHCKLRYFNGGGGGGGGGGRWNFDVKAKPEKLAYSNNLT